MKIKSKKSNLLVGASILALGIGSATGSAFAQFAGSSERCTTTTGSCSTNTTATCYAHDGVTVVPDGSIDEYCLDQPDVLYEPAGADTSANGDPRGQTCNYACNTTVCGNGGGSSGDGFGTEGGQMGFDTDMDGVADSMSCGGGCGCCGVSVAEDTAPLGQTTSWGRAHEADDAEGDGDGGDGCFVTTAVVNVIGELDDGPTLTSLRYLRDYYTINNMLGAERIKIYYDLAPAIVAKIDSYQNPAFIWRAVHKRWIEPIKKLIDDNQLDRADKLYQDMVFDLAHNHLMDHLPKEQRRKIFSYMLKYK